MTELPTPDLIAILRGIRPDESLPILTALVASGYTKVEVPLNSPEALTSIARMVAAAPDGVTIGAGTVLSVAQVEAVAAVGAQLIVSPNCNTDVIRATRRLGLMSLPGVLTPTEAFTALVAGADGLKLFPSQSIGSNGLAAMQAVLPDKTRLYAVGGIGAHNYGEWLKAGVTGFGIGSAIYRPGDTAETTGRKAKEIMDGVARFAARK